MALIVVLWLVAVIGTIAMLFYRQSTLSLKVNRNINESTQARYLAEAGVYRVIAELVFDSEQTTADYLQETWSVNQKAFGDVILGEGMYRVTRAGDEETNSIEFGAVDECSKININTASREILLRLPGATEEAVDAAIDWRDSDDDPGTYGAESEYYQTLPEPYEAKNDVYDSIEELLIVKGMTLDILYGEDINCNGILDLNENDGDKSYPIDNGDGQLNRGWYPHITAYSYEKNVDGTGEKRININTASKETLQDHFGNELSQEEIDAIVSVRDREQFQSVGELLNKTVSGNSNNNNNRNNNNQGSTTSISISREKLKNVIDKMTVSDDEQLPGKLNLNTVSRETLQIVLGDENEKLMEQIMERRQSGDGYFNSLGDVLDIEGITDSQFQQLVQSACTRSAVFSAHSAGYLERSKAYKEIYAVVDRGVDPPEIRYWKVLR